MWRYKPQLLSKSFWSKSLVDHIFHTAVDQGSPDGDCAVTGVRDKDGRYFISSVKHSPPRDPSHIHSFNPPMTKHPDIGKRVKTEDGRYGKLLAVDCDTTPHPHLFQNEDTSRGFTFLTSPSDDTACYARARAQGVVTGTRNVNWIGNYTLAPLPMKTLETLEVGDLVKSQGYFRRVLAVLGGEGELRTYALSEVESSLASEGLKEYGAVKTAYDLALYGYTPHVDAPTTVEVTLEEIAKLKGVSVDQIRVKE